MTSRLLRRVPGTVEAGERAGIGDRSRAGDASTAAVSQCPAMWLPTVARSVAATGAS